MDNVNTMSTNKKVGFFEDGKPVSRNMFIITGTVVILIRLLSDHDSKLSGGHGRIQGLEPVSCRKWSGRFYERYHVVYAPAYMYLLWITGIIAKAFSVNASTMHF